jgi:hypothetical protein
MQLTFSNASERLRYAYEISRQIFFGEKPEAGRDDLLPLQIYQMRESGYIPDDPGVYMVMDHGSGDVATSHDTKAHAVGYPQVKMFKELQSMLFDTDRVAHIVGEDFLTRTFKKLDKEAFLDRPTIYVPGDFYDMGVQTRLWKEVLDGRKFDTPQIIYNPDGFWDSLYEFAGQGGDFDAHSYEDQNIFVVRSKEELKTVLNVNGMPSAQAPADESFGPDGIKVEPGSVIAHASNNGAKRNKTLIRFLEERHDVYPLSMQNILGPVMDQEEDGGTGNANTRRKTKGTIERLMDAKESGFLQQELAKQGYDVDKFWALTTDVIVEFEQYGLAERPELAEYKTQLRPGQPFPGSEMAYVVKVHGLETLCSDINKAFDNMEKEGLPVSRKMKIRESMELFRPGNKGEKPEIYTAFAEQTYDFLHEPQPRLSGAIELEDVIAFEGESESVGTMQRRLGRWPSETYEMRVLETLAYMTGIPKQPENAPSMLQKPKGEKVILTDRHFTGTWKPEMLTREFGNKAKGLEKEGYVIPDQEDYQVQDFVSEWTDFSSRADGIVIMPPTGQETPEQLAMRAMLEFSWSVGQQLIDPLIAGKPRVQMDKALLDAKALLVRTGRDPVAPEAAYSFLPDFPNLAEALDASWNLHDYNPDPHLSDISDDVPLSTKDAIAFIGSAQTRQEDVLLKSSYATYLAHANGFDVRHGLGADGSMIEFIRGGVHAQNEGYDAHQVGVTTPLAFIEGDPKEFREQEDWPAAIVPTMQQRISGVINKDVVAVNTIGGGPGTMQEVLYALIENIKGNADRIITVDDEPLRLRDETVKAWSPVFENVLPGLDLEKYNLHYVDTAEQAIELSILHTNNIGANDNDAYYDEIDNNPQLTA